MINNFSNPCEHVVSENIINSERGELRRVGSNQSRIQQARMNFFFFWFFVF